jgi:hypothetical protein
LARSCVYRRVTSPVAGTSYGSCPLCISASVILFDTMAFDGLVLHYRIEVIVPTVCILRILIHLVILSPLEQFLLCSSR